MKKGVLLLKNKYLQIFLLIIFIIGIGLAGIFNTRGKTALTKEDLDKLSLENTKNLMIVAHPDDETIWGGGHLLEREYLVVCITNGENETRKKEFERAVKGSGNIPLILSYPDKEFGIRSHWTGYIDDIARDIQTVLSYKGWGMVVTHNLEGEYGHIHHKRVSALVTGLIDYAKGAELYYFGKYYTAKEIKEIETIDMLQETEWGGRLSEELLEKKKEILKNYLSQDFIWEKFEQMFPYEYWQKIK